MGTAGLKISETFVSLQGEGVLTGMPSWFVRLAGCNLRCAWCDTPYASWSPEGRLIDIDTLLGEARESKLSHAVVTGGEPMMFDRIGVLTEGLVRAGVHVTVETAGTIFREIACDLMSISPKLSNSTPGAQESRDPLGVWRVRHEERRLNIEALNGLLETYPKHQLKFVVCVEKDLAEIESLLGKLRGWSPAQVLLMPEGVAPSSEPGSVDRAWVVRACIERGWRYCHRVHVELFGNHRGT